MCLGLNLPKSAEQQTAAGAVWSVPWFSPIAGGHEVPILAYTPDLLLCVTWGQLQAMTWEFVAKYAEELDVVVDPSWIAANGQSPTGLDLGALIADLGAF